MITIKLVRFFLFKRKYLFGQLSALHMYGLCVMTMREKQDNWKLIGSIVLYLF